MTDSIKAKEDVFCSLANESQRTDPQEELSKEMIGTCDAMLGIFQMIRKVAVSDVPVLVTGASGTGKEMVARAIHQRSMRQKGPFVAVNCSAIPRELIESELFGHEKGSFTGAYRTSVGLVERANGGTLLLDEVGELPLEMQAKFLRFLQEHAIERVGGRKTIKLDLRVISATNCDLRELISVGRFREDLYYRLDVVNIELPPLRDRGEDAAIMAHSFLRQYSAKQGKQIKGFTQEALTAIQTHSWPGNIRELVNRIRRAVVMADGEWITPEHMSLTLQEITPEPLIQGLGLKEAKERLEMGLVASALRRYQGNVRLAAKALKTSRSVIYNLIQKYGIDQKEHDKGISDSFFQLYKSIHVGLALVSLMFSQLCLFC